MPEDKRSSAARYDGEPYTGGDFTDEFSTIVYDDIMRRLNGMIEANLYEDGIMLKKYQLTLSCTIQRIGESKGRYSAEMLFILSHSMFDEPLCEYSSGIGESAEEAIVKGTGQFTEVVLMSIIGAFECSGKNSIDSEFAGFTRHFVCTDDPLIYVIGEEDEDQPDLFGLIRDLLPEYLGTKKAYWVKLFAVCYDNKINVEVRINGAVMYDLTDRLVQYVLKRKDRQAFHSEKQFVLMLDNDTRDDEIYAPAELVIDLTKNAVDLLSEVVDEESERAAFFKLKTLCGKWQQLAVDMFAFIPNLFTCHMFQLKQGDTLRLSIGDAVVFMKRSQLRYFGYIEQGIMQYLNETPLADENAYNVMNMGYIIDALSAVYKQGIDIEHIGIKEIAADLPEDYQLF